MNFEFFHTSTHEIYTVLKRGKNVYGLLSVAKTET